MVMTSEARTDLDVPFETNSEFESPYNRRGGEQTSLFLNALISDPVRRPKNRDLEGEVPPPMMLLFRNLFCILPNLLSHPLGHILSFISDIAWSGSIIIVRVSQSHQAC